MNRRVAIAAVLVLAATLVFLASSSGGASGSTLSYGALGWRGLAATLEELASARTLTRWPAEGEALELSDEETLVVAFPWLRYSEHHFDQITEWVRGGGSLILAYDGRTASVAESRLLAHLGLGERDADSRSSLLPWRWRREERQSEHALQGAQSLLATAKLRYSIEPPASDATRILAGTDALPIVSSFPIGRGRVRLLPTSAFANAFLHRPGNSALLVDWIEEGDRRWVFDELHHGFGNLPAAEREASRFLDRMTLQLLALYVAALLAFAWRFGPTWPERPAAFDSHREFLVGLGELHGRLGHEAQAARLLADRWVRYAQNRFTAEEALELERLASRGDLLAVANRAQHDSPRRGEPDR